MAFLKKSTSRLKTLGDKLGKPVSGPNSESLTDDINSAPIPSKTSSSQAKSASVNPADTLATSSGEDLNKVFEKLEKSYEALLTGESHDAQNSDLQIPIQQDTETSSNTNRFTSDENMEFVSKNIENYESPSFFAKLDQPDNHIDVTPQTTTHASTTTQERRHNSDTHVSDDDRNFDVGLPPVIPRAARADLSSMRLDVARISADIQSGEELYRRAQQRIENLTTFVESADIDLSLLNRLEPENRRLKARNRTIESELDDKQRKLSLLTIDLEDHRKRLEERNASFEQTQSKLSIATKSLQTYERALHTVQQKLDKSDLSQERVQTALSVERRENEILRDRITEMSAEVEEKNLGYIEAKKVADSLAQDCNDFRQASDTAYKANIELRNALDSVQKQNNAMKGEMISLHEDIRTFKTQYEFNIISREDELTALQNQTSTLKKQLDVKDEIVRNAARDITELRKIRTAQDLERERLEAQINAQAFQLDELNAELLLAKQNETDFDRRYRDVATALSVTQARRTSRTPVQEPDIHPQPQARAQALTPPPLAPALTPAPMATPAQIAAAKPAVKAKAVPTSAQTPTQTPEQTPTQTSAQTQSESTQITSSINEDLDDEKIMERITEFKLGLRKNIT